VPTWLAAWPAKRNPARIRRPGGVSCRETADREREPARAHLAPIGYLKPALAVLWPSLRLPRLCRAERMATHEDTPMKTPAVFMQEGDYTPGVSSWLVRRSGAAFAARPIVGRRWRRSPRDWRKITGTGRARSLACARADFLPFSAPFLPGWTLPRSGILGGVFFQAPSAGVLPPSASLAIDRTHSNRSAASDHQEIGGSQQEPSGFDCYTAVRGAGRPEQSRGEGLAMLGPNAVTGDRTGKAA
jgi:hypothetical protein